MNEAGQVYPDQSLYPVDSAPSLIRRLNNALVRADQIQHLEGKNGTYWFAPIIADAEAGFGGLLNSFELTKAMIEAGVAGIHFEDQLSSVKKCGHVGGKVLVPTEEYIHKLISARLAADVLDVPTILIARTDAEDARLIRSDHDPVDRPFLTGERSSEGFFYVKNGTDYAISKARAYAPFVEMLWCETSKPDLVQARDFAQGVHEKFPDKLLAYNCSPSFNWKKYLGEKDLRNFHDKLAELGYKFQFITLAGFHTLNASMFELARAYKQDGMAAYSILQEREFELERSEGYRAIKHQAFVGAGYFDEVQMVVSNRSSSTGALTGSTEAEQFEPAMAGESK
jgi:isocitrate lyase